MASSRHVQYQVQMTDMETNRIIAGYEVIRFGVPMIGEWDNEGRAPSGKIVTISPAVPGARYRITAWALDSGTRRSAEPAVESVTTGEASEWHSLHEHNIVKLKNKSIGLFSLNPYITAWLPQCRGGIHL